MATAHGSATPALRIRSELRSGTLKMRTASRPAITMPSLSIPNHATGAPDSIGTRVSFTGSAV